MLKIYNTLSRKKEIFKPRKNRLVNLFVCGPTVYDFSHIGHARTYIFFDSFAKYLKEKGYKVFYLQNITDIDDKIIKRAEEERTVWKELSRKFEKDYLKDVKSLGINSVTKYARATNHIKEIISQVKRLMKKGFAYQIEDGIYYDISKFKDYGKLSKRTVLQAQDAVSRIDESIQKRNKGDFCLWKFTPHQILVRGGAKYRKNLYEPSWSSPFGPGRPGWHIEDTAITEKYFGPQYDIHGGAIELSFPHHEAEIAQMEAISGKKPLVKYWLHTGLLTINGQKMSKSLKNFITIREFLNSYSARILRLFVLSSHYRSPIDYNQEKIEQIKNQLERLDEFLDKLKKINQKIKKYYVNKNFLEKIKKKIEMALEDDFNTPKALGVLFEFIKKINILFDKNQIDKNQAKKILSFLKEIDRFFNFIFIKAEGKIPLEIIELVKEREKARQEKNWKLADEIREKVQKLGYQIQDTSEGPKIKKI